MVLNKNTQFYSIRSGDRLYNIFNVINNHVVKESCAITEDVFIKVNISIPNKLCTLKNNYKIGDEVFVGSKYVMILTKVFNENPLMLRNKRSESTYTGSLYTLVPKNWWILHENCKSAMMEVSKCLLRCNIYKDMRVLIAKEIWKTCNDYEWDFFK